MGKITDDEQKKVFAENLNYYVSLSGKNQKDIAVDLEINPPTFNTWCTGTSIPNVSTIKRLAAYFNCLMTQLVDKQPNQQEQTCFLDNEISKIATQIKNDKNLLALFEIAKDANPEDLQTIYQLLLVLKNKENNK